MADDTSVPLGDDLVRFIDQRVDDGRYRSASEVVRAGLSLLEEHEAKLDALRTALAEGEAGGRPAPFDVEEFLRSKRG